MKIYMVSLFHRATNNETNVYAKEKMIETGIEVLTAFNRNINIGHMALD